jgi:tRNA A37 threonylcarbamoyladenosine dehydratase
VRQIHVSTAPSAAGQVMAERCRAINPQAHRAGQGLLRGGQLGRTARRGYDYVLDCIDHISAKLHRSRRKSGLPVISSMGVANKLDPTKIAVADLF